MGEISVSRNGIIATTVETSSSLRELAIVHKGVSRLSQIFSKQLEGYRLSEAGINQREKSRRKIRYRSDLSRNRRIFVKAGNTPCYSRITGDLTIIMRMSSHRSIRFSFHAGGRGLSFFRMSVEAPATAIYSDNRSGTIWRRRHSETLWMWSTTLCEGIDRYGENGRSMGGSYGGYLTNWTITHTQRFKDRRSPCIRFFSFFYMIGKFMATGIRTDVSRI